MSNERLNLGRKIWNQIVNYYKVNDNKNNSYPIYKISLKIKLEKNKTCTTITMEFILYFVVSSITVWCLFVLVHSIVPLKVPNCSNIPFVLFLDEIILSNRSVAK